MSKALRVLLLLIVVSIGIGTQLGAQDSEVYGLIVFGEGEEVLIYRQGVLTVSSGYELVGNPLLPGDLVQTSNDTFLEVQIMPSQTIMKIAENTTFEFTDLSSGGGGAFEMIYGRVRAQVNNLAGTGGDFTIRGRSAIAGVRGTDFGYDYIADPLEGYAPKTNVYCFEGAVEVFDPDAVETSTDDGSDSSESSALETSPGSVLIGANEMVAVQEAPVIRSPANGSDSAETSSVDTVNPAPRKLAAQVIDETIQTFWDQKNFETAPVEASEVSNRFPELASKLQRAKELVALRAERSQEIASGQREEARPSILQLPSPEPSAADAIAALEFIDIDSVIPNLNPMVLAPNPTRIAGATFSVTGAVVAATGLLLPLTSEAWGIEPSLATALSTGLTIGGGVLSLTGIIFYLAAYNY